MSMSHRDCQTDQGHVCQKPSGRPCVEYGCELPAGTHWGPLWCPEHDEERLNRIAAGLDGLFK